MVTKWEPEQEEEDSQPKLEYQVNAHITLEDSDTQTWGMVKDTEDNFLWKPGEGILVGKWSRSPVDGLIHVFLETPLMALVDKATQRFAEYAERRRTTSSAPKTRSKSSRTPKVEPVAIPAEELTTINNLRKLLGK